MATVTQGSLMKFREKMFDKMQTLPVRYFDTHNHGDIMKPLYNDIDTLRQMISQSFIQLLVSGIMVTTVFCIMIYYCVWMTLVVIAGVVCMFFITKKVGGKSTRYFIRQQEALGHVEGYVEEMMNGQKVVKVFCHEEETKEDFDRINEELFHEAETANKYANTLGPSSITWEYPLCGRSCGWRYPSSGERTQRKPFRKGAGDQYCRSFPEYDETVCR